MRVLLATTANAGHFGPMVPFARACLRAGHEVLVAAPASFAAAVRQAGLPCWPCQDVDQSELAPLLARVYAEPPEKRNEAMESLGAELGARSIMPGLLGALNEWQPDAILRETGETGSTIAGELRGVRTTQLLVGLDKFVEFTLPRVARALAGYRESLGLPPDRDGVHLHAQPSVSLLPPSFEEPGGPAVHRFRAPADPPAPLPTWSTADLPLVYVTFGTVASGLPFTRDAFRAVVDAVADLPARVLVTIGADGDPGEWPMPEHVRVEKWVPHQDVLAEAAVMVCHGGTGTVLGALTAGVPMVVVPQFADQPDVAARVAATGAGLSVGEGERAPATADEIRAAVKKVLADPSFRAGAAALAAEIAALPPVDDAVGLITGAAS